MRQSELCPFCTAGIADCEHEMVRWSLYAGEFEPCQLLPDVLAFCDAVARLMRHCRKVNWPQNWRELQQVYERCIEGSPEYFDENEEGLEAAPPIVEYVLATVGELPGVVNVIEGLPNDQQTQVLWSPDPQAMGDQIPEKINTMEVEIAREEVC